MTTNFTADFTRQQSQLCQKPNESCTMVATLYPRSLDVTQDFWKKKLHVVEIRQYQLKWLFVYRFAKVVTSKNLEQRKESVCKDTLVWDILECLSKGSSLYRLCIGQAIQETSGSLFLLERHGCFQETLCFNRITDMSFLILCNLVKEPPFLITRS